MSLSLISLTAVHLCKQFFLSGQFSLQLKQSMTPKTTLESSAMALCVSSFCYIEYQTEMPGRDRGGHGRTRLMMTPALSRISLSEAGIAALASCV